MYGEIEDLSSNFIELTSKAIMHPLKFSFFEANSTKQFD